MYQDCAGFAVLLISISFGSYGDYRWRCLSRSLHVTDLVHEVITALCWSDIIQNWRYKLPLYNDIFCVKFGIRNYESIFD